LTRVETIGNATLYLGDCREILPTLGKVDAVVTDPPYGVNFRNEKWDTHIPDWFDAGRSIADAVVVFTAPTTLWDYPRPEWVCNWYRPASSSRTIWGGFNHWTPVLVYGKANPQVDSINLHAIANAYREDVGHPSPKPVAAMEWALDIVPKARSIVDPFMGSGTTGVACAKLGRKFIGIEIEPKYFDIACRRIESAYKQPDMFIERPAPATQEPLF
jgi:DNA modification methylase